MERYNYKSIKIIDLRTSLDVRWYYDYIYDKDGNIIEIKIISYDKYLKLNNKYIKNEYVDLSNNKIIDHEFSKKFDGVCPYYCEYYFDGRNIIVIYIDTNEQISKINNSLQDILEYIANSRVYFEKNKELKRKPDYD